ncbi:M16 family metallopeptidase [Marinomonas sp. TW1]|uniref:M16 family metallopeptidase n=1 Tax=Marinomonas sp. TW1 TaxID=1561203 RepID=UPI0009EDE23C|nr:insulinase family protein [Marinomonas sp. TW1]
MMFYQRVLSVLFCLLVQPVLANEVGELSWDKRIVRGTLDNGFQYYIFDSRQESDYPEQLTMATLFVKAGAMDEEQDQLGVAHMVEHMVFHESDDYPQSVRSALTELGLKQGRGFNAMTNSENTRYMMNLKKTDDKSLSAMLKIYQQMAFYAQIKDESLIKERLVIEEEWRKKLSPRTRINEEKKSLLRVGSLYPERPVIGTQESIKNTSVERLKAFYQDWYQPSNMALILYTPSNPEHLAKQIQQLFGQVENNPLPPRHEKDPQLDDTLKIGQLTDAAGKINRVAYLLRYANYYDNSQQGRRNGLIDYMARRLLTQQVRRQNSTLDDQVRTFSSTKGSVSPNVDILGFSVNVDTGFHALGLSVLASELAAIQQQGFYQADFDAIRQKVMDTVETNKQAAQQRGSLWSMKMLDAVASNKVLADPEMSNNQVLEVLPTIHLDDVNQRMRDWLSSADRILYSQAVGGKKVELGNAEAVEKLFSNALQATHNPLQKAVQVVDKVLPESDSSGEYRLLSRDTQLGLSEWQLSNGDGLTLLDPTVLAERYADVYQPAEESISYFSAYSKAGYQVLEGNHWAEQIALQLSEATGIYGWTEKELIKWRQTHKINLSIKQKAQSVFYRGNTEDENFDTLFAYYHQSQSLPNINLPVYQDVMETLLRNAKVDVVRVNEAFARAVAKTRFGDEQELVPSVEGLEPLSFAELNQVRERQIAQPVQYFIVSRLDEQELLMSVAKHLASIPRVDTQTASSVWQTQAVLQKAGHRILDLPINETPKAEFRLYAYQDMPWSPQLALQLIYLGERLEEVLKRQLRDKVQGVYSVRVGLELNRESNRAELSVQFSSDPQRVDALASQTEQVLADLPALITPQWVAETQAAFVDVENNRLKTSFRSTLVHRLELSFVKFDDARYLNDMSQLAGSLTLDDFQKLVHSLQFDNKVLAYLRPKSSE